MLFVRNTKEEFIQLLPRGGRWAEIGVFEGEFSATILANCRPDELHLVDPWHYDLDFDWFAPEGISPKWGDAKRFVEQTALWADVAPGRHINDRFEELFQGVRSRFAPYSNVTIHRQTAHAAAGAMPDGAFDVVFVDGAHDFGNALQDIKDYDRKLKPGGALLGHDYCEHGTYATADCGVVGAVTHFRKISSPRELVVNAERFSTFGLFQPGSPTWKIFFDNLIRSRRAVLELPDAIAANHWHRPVHTSDGQVWMLQSFA